jgi:hypothetical protein
MASAGLYLFAYLLCSCLFGIMLSVYANVSKARPVNCLQSLTPYPTRVLSSITHSLI